jgi:hypothetical protein
MKLFPKITLSLCLAAGLLFGPALAQPTKDDVVARVFDVKGDSLQVQREGQSKWEKGKKDTAGFIKDHFRTDKATTAALELLIGARVGIKPNSEIVLLSEDAAGQVDGKNVRKIKLNSGGVYAKFHKQDKPLTIQTRGGVMGIKGTEFSVETDENQTSITLLEGDVDYTPASSEETSTEGTTEASEGVAKEPEPIDLEPGQKLTQFEKDGETHVVKGEPSEVDKAVNDFLNDLVPIANINSVQDVLNRNWANLGPDAVNNLIFNTRQGILGELPPVISNLINGWVPSIPSLSSWGNLNYIGVPSINVPGIPSIPSFPRF